MTTIQTRRSGRFLRTSWVRLGALLLVALASGAHPARAQPVRTQAGAASAPAAAADSAAPVAPALRAFPDPAPVVLRGDTLFWFRAALGPFMPADRARAATQRILRIADDPIARADSLHVVDELHRSDVLSGGTVLFSVTEDDAAAAGRTRAVLTADLRDRVSHAVQGETFWARIRTIAMGVGATLLATVVLILLLKGLGRLVRRLQSQIHGWRGTNIRGLRIKNYEILSAERMVEVLASILRGARIVAVILLLYFYVPLVFSFFPWTRDLGTTVLGYVVHPLWNIAKGLVGYVPSAFAIAAIVVVTHYLLRLIHLLFRALENGNIQFEGFHKDWAEPTYKIVRFLVLAFALVLIFPYLPGSGSDAFKGVSVFFGLLLSLGSSSAISNAISGIVITYMRPFQTGDRVKIADTTGDVVQRTLLVTRIRTIKNVQITVPNAMVLSSHIVNYSAAASEGGLILHTSVTIGYDAPWRRVHELLIEAAGATDDILEDPKPFVLQTALDDFYVRYELNAYTGNPPAMARIYSDLHRNIQDAFNAAGVEIMSPHYGALRDGNHTTIPETHLPQGYKPPAFRVTRAGDGETQSAE